MSIQTFTPDSRAGDRENYKRTSYLYDHPRRCLSYRWYHSRHSQRQFGSSVLCLGPSLQGELCQQPNYVAYLCKVSQPEQDQSPLTCIPYVQSAPRQHCCNATGQLPMTGHRGWHQTRRRNTALAFPSINKAWLWRHKTQRLGIWASDLRAKRLHFIMIQATHHPHGGSWECGAEATRHRGLVAVPWLLCRPLTAPMVPRALEIMEDMGRGGLFWPISPGRQNNVQHK